MTGLPSRWLAISRAAASISIASTSPKLAEHGQIVAGAAADLQDARVVGQRDAPPDQPVENVAAGDIPPMLLVELRHIVVDAAVHQANTQKRLSEKVTSGVTNRIGMSGHQARAGKHVRTGEDEDEDGVETEADQAHDEEARRCVRAALSRAAMVPEAPAAVQDIARDHRDEIAGEIGDLRGHDPELGRSGE